MQRKLRSVTYGALPVHISHKGGSPAVTDLPTGQVSLMFGSMPSVLPQLWKQVIESGRIGIDG